VDKVNLDLKKLKFKKATSGKLQAASFKRQA
jgi:hypothetical protein